jgi:hypothetical protein
MLPIFQKKFVQELRDFSAASGERCAPAAANVCGFEGCHDPQRGVQDPKPKACWRSE